MTAQDLENYSIEENTPLKTNYRGLDVFTNNPPGGGIMLIEMLNILENFNLQELKHNSLEYIKIASETMKRATIDKDRFVGDPNFVEIPIAKLTSKKYAHDVSKLIENGEKAAVERLNSFYESKDTTQVLSLIHI